MPQDQRKVHGIVFNANQQPQPGLTVRVFDGEVELGSAQTNAQGYYAIGYSATLVHDLLVRVYNQEGQVLGESTLVQNPGENANVNVILAETGETYQVVGKITSTVRAALAGLRVVIEDVNVGQDVPQAETVSDPSGAYQVKFSDVDLRRRGKAQPDLL